MVTGVTMVTGVNLLLFLLLAGASAQGDEEKEWPECDSASADKTSSNPNCDPCSPRVYTEYNNPINTEVYQKPTSRLNNYILKGWTRFMQGTGRLLQQCPLMYSCGAIYPIWLNSEHPAQDDGIVEGEVCAHFTNGNCCTYKRAIHMKNCGNYYVYLLTYNSPVSSSYNGAYCVVPKEQPDVCNDDGLFTLTEDSTARGELQTTTSTTSEPVHIADKNTWVTFLAGKGTIKKTCPGIHHCGFRYPMWIEEDYPTKEGQIVMTMGHAAISGSNICSITSSQPVYIVKCGDKFYHKLMRVVTYSGFCVDEDLGDICDNAVTLGESWRGTTVDKARDHCDTLGLTDFESWYRIGVFENKMPDHCVAPNKCGADNGYYVGGNIGHPAPGDGIVGRTFYYSTSSNCAASGLQGHILNCGNKDDGDDWIYKWNKPSGCDKVFCAEQDPCSSTVYKKLNEAGRAGRTSSPGKVNDVSLEHGWYRFSEGEGIMSKSPVLPGHSAISYPGWYEGEYPLEEDDERQGRACFTYNGNNCYYERPVTVRNCKKYYVYHLQTTASNYGYTYEQDVCKLDTLKLDQEWRLQYNLDSLALTDSTLPAGWYEVTLGERQLASTPTLFKQGGSSKYPGWIEGEHPTEEEGIVERTVYFTTTDTNNKGSSTKVYIRNCGSKYIYYLRPYSNNYFYAIAQELCEVGSYVEVDQDNRLFSNPSELSNAWNSDSNYFKTYTQWYRFMNGNGRAAEYPKIKNNWYGGFQYPYQFPDGSHASVPDAGDISEPILMEHWRAPGTERYTGWTWRINIANCGGYFLYRIPPLSTSYGRSGLVVDDDPMSLCESERYIETDDKFRLVSSTATGTGTSDYYLSEGWYRLTAGLGYMPTSIFVGTQCSATYHGHLEKPHPSMDEGIVENRVQFRSTSTSVSSNKRAWVKTCDGYYLYRLTASPGATYRYCEATEGCKHARELEDMWRVNSRKLMTGRYESSTFGNDGWVYFSQGLRRMPESPPPKSVGGCTYSGYIDSHPAQEEGAVPRVMRFPGVDKEQPIEVENCGDKYVYFLTKSIANDYCYVADTDVCSDDVYREVSDVRRLHYSHKYGTAHTRFNLDHLFNGWIRYTVGKGRLMEEPPAITGMCTTEHQGWINGSHPGENDGVVRRQVCWKFSGQDCHQFNDISVKNCGDYYVYGIAKPPPNNQYGHCIEQDKTEVCESATKLDNPKRGMLTPTTSYINDQLTIVQAGYYRFMSGLGRLTGFRVKDPNCGGKYRVLIENVVEKDEEEGDALLQLRSFTTSFTGSVYRNLALDCDGYWVYSLQNINQIQLAYCVEEDVCESSEIKWIYSTNYMQWLKETTENEWHVLSTGWYEVKVGNKRLAYSPSDLYDCSSTYPGYIQSEPASLSDGIVPGRVCYRTSDSSVPSTCYDISMKKCPTKELYYLSKSPSANYALCVETDVCSMVEGIELKDTWRLSGTPAAAGGKDTFKIGWYRVTIGNERLAHNREEAKCGASYQGWMTLGRHPNTTEGTVNTRICYDTGNGKESNCKDAQVVNCGSHYLYHLRPATTSYGVCIESAEDSMCKNHGELSEEWRSTEYSATNSNTDTGLTAGWYRFTTGLGRMATHCPAYLHGGGYYPSYAHGIDEMPSSEVGVVQFLIYWRSSGSCTWISSTSYVRNCGDYPVYWLPKRTNGYTTYNVEADSCSADQYEELDDARRLAWKPTTDFQTDLSLKQGWYRFMNGLQMINEECTPQHYGGTYYPGWMTGGHPDVGVTVDRTVYFRYSTNCKQTLKYIKVKNCGSFYIYRLVPTANNYGYTAASDPCDVEPRLFDQEDRSIYERSRSVINDNGIAEGWYQFTTGNGVMAKSPMMEYSCRTPYPVWMEGADPSPGEGIVTRSICAVSGSTTPCRWTKEIKVRNCGNDKMLYYFTASPPYSTARYCVDDTMDNACKGAKVLNDDWRGSDSPGTGHVDRNLPEGWYKFNSHVKRLANFAVPKNYCGAEFPIYMEGDHADRGECKSQVLMQVYADNNWTGRSGYIYECQCMNGDYMYYHVPSVSPLTVKNGAYCVEEEPCNNFVRYTGGTRSPWSNALINPNDHASPPKWVKVDTGLGQMPMYSPETTSCGSYYPAWYEGELPKQVGLMARGRYCFVTSATAKCSSPRDAKVLLCDGGYYVYHVLPTASANYGYCADSDVCDVASEEWGREENHRLRQTSISGYYSSTRKSDTSMGNSWFRVTTGLKRLPSECVGYMSCGTLYPGWLNGEHPEPADRVVDRQVCFVTGTTDSCCGATKDIKVVSCVRNNEQFYLYRLYATSSNYGYCVDEAPDEVCKLSNSEIKYISDERHGTGHYYDSNFKPDYQLYPIPGWSEVNVHQKRLLHQLPTQYFCGGIYAGWVEDPAPGPNDGVVASRACFRDSMTNENCYQPMPLKMKNCEGKIRYLYAPPSVTRRNMCVEEDICDAASHKVFDKETWRLAFTKTEGGVYKTDYNKMSTSPYRGWFRFTGAGRNKITEVQQEFISCGTYYPAWLYGEHPTTEDGVVKRTLAVTTAASTYTSKTTEIFVRNCGSFMLYNINFNWWNANWGFCIDTDVCDADVTELNEDHRLLNTWGLITASYDSSLARGWYKFTNGFEKMPETCPIANACGSLKPGYLSQPHPEIGEGIVERKVCFGDADQCCSTSRDVLVKNCGTHFVYRLYPTTTYEKYCVEEGPNTMCSGDVYTELDDEWRGEKNPYDSTNKHDDTQLVPGNWYRFMNYLGRMPEYSLSIYSCGHYYPGYLLGTHPIRQDGIKNDQVCFSTSMTNEGQSCKNVRVRNCGSYYVYQLTKPASWYYGFCVAQDQCEDATVLADRWRLVVNPTVSGQSKAADQNTKKGWYRFTIGHGTMPLYEPDTGYGGAAYPSWMLGELPEEDEGEAERTAKFAGTTATKTIRVKNCGEHYVYWLQPSANANYVYSIDTDVCLHAQHLSEEWRNMFYVSESEDDLHTDYQRGKDWYRFTTGFQMMAESPPGPRYSCGTTHPAYLNQAHPSVEDGVVAREVCWKADEEENIYQACFEVENIRVKNCGDYYTYQLNPQINNGAYCVYNRKTSCEPKVVHAKYGELAVVNCTLNSEKDFDSSEVEWTKLNSVTLPDDSLNNIEISDDKLLLNINDIADQNAGVYALYIPSTATSELVEVILYSAVEASQKYYVVEEGGDVQIDVEFNVVPPPPAEKIEWKKLPNKELTDGKYSLNDDKSSLTIKGVTGAETGTYRVSVQFVVGAKSYKKHSDVIVQLEEKEEEQGRVM